MVSGVRPKFRYAAKYLKERFAKDGSKLPPSITTPNYLSKDLSLEPPFEKDEYYKRNEKYFFTGGVYLYISKLLYEKGPLTRKEIWMRYKADAAVDRSDVNIRSSTCSPGLTQLKVDFLNRMKEEKLILNAGYSSIEKRNVGYVVNPRKAFERVPSAHQIHPAILFAMNPWPDCYLVNRYRVKLEPGTPGAGTQLEVLKLK